VRAAVPVVFTTDIVAHPTKASDAAYIAAASPSVVLELVEQTMVLKSERDAYYECYKAEIEDAKRQAARIAELEAGLREACDLHDEMVHVDWNFDSQIKQHDAAAERIAAISALAEGK